MSTYALALDVGGTFTDVFVSPENARSDYGVVLDPQTLEVDKDATCHLRQRLQGPTAMFHRGRYLTELSYG